MTRYYDPPPGRVPRSAVRIRIAAALGVAVEVLSRLDAYVAACLDVRPLRRHARRVRTGVRAAYGRARDRARRRAFGPAHALVAVPRPRYRVHAIDVTSPCTSPQSEKEIDP